jgi:hypothetical protein
VDAHHAAIDNHYLSSNNQSVMDSDCMEAAGNDRSISHCSNSNLDDNFATFLAPPPSAHKTVAEKVERKEKPAKTTRKTIGSSSSNSNKKDMAYAQSNSAFAKSLKKLLAFSSNTK